MMNIIEVILLKYPNIQGVAYWHTKYNGSEWEDPYDGLVWENQEIPKPTKQQILDWIEEESLNFQINKKIESFQKATEQYIDSKVREKGYDNGLSCATYLTSSNPKWSAESQAFISWRDLVWEYAFSLMDNLVENSNLSLEDYLEGMPELVWPEL